MNYVVKNKWLIGLLILLLAANFVTIATFWLTRRPQQSLPKGRPDTFLIKELNLDTKQQEQLKLLVSEHRAAAEQIRHEVKEGKDSFFDLIKEPNIADSIKRIAAAAISRNTERLDLLTLEHFQKIRALCNPVQQQKFDKIIHEITSMMAPPPRGPGGPPPPQD